MEAGKSSYKCQTCGKNYKSSASLASHRYRTHPRISDSSSIVSQSSPSSVSEHNENVENTMDYQTTIDNIRSAIYQLRDVFDDLESKVLTNEESIKHMMKHRKEIAKESSSDSDTESLSTEEKVLGKGYRKKGNAYEKKRDSAISSDRGRGSTLLGLHNKFRFQGL